MPKPSKYHTIRSTDERMVAVSVPLMAYEEEVIQKVAEQRFANNRSAAFRYLIREAARRLVIPTTRLPGESDRARNVKPRAAEPIRATDTRSVKLSVPVTPYEEEVIRRVADTYCQRNKAAAARLLIQEAAKRLNVTTVSRPLPGTVSPFGDAR